MSIFCCLELRLIFSLMILEVQKFYVLSFLYG